MEITNEISTKVYCLGQGSFEGNALDENLHSEWVFIITETNQKFYGKVIEDDFGFFVINTELFESIPYRNQFTNYNNVSISDNTIIQQYPRYNKICYELSGGSNEMNAFQIYYFADNKLFRPQINDISRRWENILMDYANPIC